MYQVYLLSMHLNSLMSERAWVSHFPLQGRHYTSSASGVALDTMIYFYSLNYNGGELRYHGVSGIHTYWISICLMPS